MPPEENTNAAGEQDPQLLEVTQATVNAALLAVAAGLSREIFVATCGDLHDQARAAFEKLGVSVTDL